MNDFTIEELERLSLMAIKFSDRFNPNDTDPLCIKLQSMINSYCEHDEIKITKRKCPLCQSEFSEAKININTQELITNCSNINCRYFMGLRL